MGCVCPVFPRANARFRALPHQATRLPGPFAQARTRANKALAMALGGTGLVLVVKCAGAWIVMALRATAAIAISFGLVLGASHREQSGLFEFLGEVARTSSLRSPASS